MATKRKNPNPPGGLTSSGLTTPLSLLQYLLDENGMKQADLAKLLGVTPSVVSRIMHGRRGLTTEHISKICHRFKVSADLFIK